jgi:hypothetical protein
VWVVEVRKPVPHPATSGTNLYGPFNFKAIADLAKELHELADKHTLARVLPLISPRQED